MSKSTEPKSDPPPAIKQRFIGCVQSTGRVGKSFVADALASWLDFARVTHALIDADGQHHTLSDRRPNVHLLEATASEDEFRDLLATLPDVPVLVVDFPGQSTERILRYAEHFKMLQSFALQGIRPTLWVFMGGDDETAKDSAAATMEFFGTAADYILVENSAKFRSEGFKGTDLYDWFIAQDSPTLTVPRISLGTMREWDRAQHRLGRYLSLDDVVKLTDLSITARLELDGSRSWLLSQFEDCAAKLLPDVGLIKNRVSRTQAVQPTKRPANRLGSPLLVKK
jgi:hypothetical protein